MIRNCASCCVCLGNFTAPAGMASEMVLALGVSTTTIGLEWLLSNARVKMRGGAANPGRRCTC